jgi:hypothetical protein
MGTDHEGIPGMQPANLFLSDLPDPLFPQTPDDISIMNEGAEGIGMGGFAVVLAVNGHIHCPLYPKTKSGIFRHNNLPGHKSFHSLTEPMLIPAMKYFWQNG